MCALHYEWNELEPATAYLRQAISLAERADHGEFLIAALLLQARLHAGQGDFDAARNSVSASHRRGLRDDVPSQALSRSAAAGVEVALAQGDVAEARRWAAQVVDDVDAHPFYRFFGLTPARLLVADGEKQAAATALADLAERALQAGWEYGLIAVRVLQASAAESPDRALAFLADALSRARAGRLVRTFGDAGPAILPLLQTAATRRIHPDYAEALLAALGGHSGLVEQTAPASTLVVPHPATALTEPLSQREVEVLRLMATGLSNAAIADTLVVSQGTVKTHVHHICGKLGASNRTEAVARARQLGFL
jgi:LuxR family maltose regulon positive regulatory protein